MNRCLLQIAIGPVQDFIAAARRTRDLWFGSALLSEISKAAAKAVKDTGGELIFPFSDNLAGDLAPMSSFNVANVILVDTRDENQAKALSAAAREAAQTQWGKFVDDAYKTLKGFIDQAAWDYQKEDVIEFYSAWYPYEENNDKSYTIARKEVARLLAARKSLRDFKVWKGKPGIPKSSLDGLRESVLLKDSPDSDANLDIRNIRIKQGEALDVVGCVKRTGGGRASGERASFPSVTRIALDPWIRRFQENEKSETKRSLLSALREQCEVLVNRNALSKIDSSFCSYDMFPYEGPALLPQRYHDFEEGLVESALADVQKTTSIMREIMQKLSPKPLEPYLAVLAADGDKMGQAISKLKSPADHQEFSKTLSKFAGKARKIVQESHGSCVYTGGDDVLAFLPLDTVVNCARRLHDAFSNLWKKEAEKKEIKWGLSEAPTLSVGIAIGHALEDLEDLLRFGREAEKLAKKGFPNDNNSNKERNALAITVHARGNSEIAVREQWNLSHNVLQGEDSTPRVDVPAQGADGASNNAPQEGEPTPLASLPLDERLKVWVGYFYERKIPSKFPYELREAVKFYQGWTSGEAPADTMRAEAMGADAVRIFRRKNSQSDETRLNEKERRKIEEYLCASVKGPHESLERLANELLIAQWLDVMHASTEGRQDNADVQNHSA
jgi:CRISPR-associated protein Cmr2